MYVYIVSFGVVSERFRTDKDWKEFLQLLEKGPIENVQGNHVLIVPDRVLFIKRIGE